MVHKTTDKMDNSVTASLYALTDPTLPEKDAWYVVETLFLRLLPDQQIVPNCIASARNAASSVDWFRQVAHCYCLKALVDGRQNELLHQEILN